MELADKEDLAFSLSSDIERKFQRFLKAKVQKALREAQQKAQKEIERLISKSWKDLQTQNTDLSRKISSLLQRLQ